VSQGLYIRHGCFHGCSATIWMRTARQSG
jgi:hypothetical protein